MPSSPKLKIKIPFLILLALLPSEAILFFVPGPQGSATPAAISSMEILDLTNRSRRAANIKPLNHSLKLERAAILKAKSIMENGHFSHVSKNGEDFTQNIKKQKYSYLEAGENLAMDFLTPDAVVASWLKSEAHRKNLLNPNFRDIGIASLTGQFNGVQTTIVVQLLAKPSNKNDN